jgi:hypothetical protein
MQIQRIVAGDVETGCPGHEPHSRIIIEAFAAGKAIIGVAGAGIGVRDAGRTGWRGFG